MKMSIKIAYAVIYYTSLAFQIFLDTCPEISLLQEAKHPTLEQENIFNGILFEDEVLTILLLRCKEEIGLCEKNVPSYADVLLELNVLGITLPTVKDAAKILIRAMDVKKEDIDSIGYIIN